MYVNQAVFSGTFVVAQKALTVQVGPPKSDAVSALLFSSKILLKYLMKIMKKEFLLR